MEKALLGLELKGYLAADDVNSFGASQAYAFRRDSVRDAAYVAIPQDGRRHLHLEAANWLITLHNRARPSAWLSIDSMIAHHFAMAGETVWADAWRQRADSSGVTR